MKVNVEIDLTPEEARRAMGLPDLTPVHDLYLDKVKRSIEEGVTPDTIKAMMQAWAPMGEAGFAIWRQLLGQMGSGSFKGTNNVSDK